MRSRIVIVFCGLMFLWGLLVLRAGQLQIFPDQRLKSVMARQFQSVVTLQPRRGAVLDRKGRDLALSTMAYSLYADPSVIEKPRQLSRKLAPVLGQSASQIYDKIDDKKRKFVWLARLLPKDKADVIRSWKQEGLSLVEEFRRVYPNEHLLGQTLGFIGQEGQGLEGLELQYDSLLKGEKRKVSLRRDARGRPLLVDGLMFADTLEGAELRLTIDSEVQHMLEMEVQHAVTEFEAEQGFAIVLEAQTSKILAMATSKRFDPNVAGQFSASDRRNRIVTDSFEPGSVIKTFAIAGALREKLIAPNTSIDTEGGRLRVGDRIIRESDASHNWEKLTVSEVLAFSSNVGTTKIAFQLGAEQLRRAFVDFGFGAKSGVDLPGEARGTLHPLPWRPHLLSNVSFGQGMTATPLQVANAYAVIANGGVLKAPQIVESIRDPESGELTVIPGKEIRRVLDPQDAMAMRMLLAGVSAPGGTGVNAKVDGFIIGGKTGTAQKVNPNGRGYLPGGYISSFAGFIPANDPKYVIFAAIDHPKKKNSYYGSQVAAPLFSRVASSLVRKDGLAPLSLTEKNLVPRREAPVSTQDSRTVKTSGEVLKSPLSREIEKMPPLEGLTAREVIRKLQGQDLNVQFVGSGVVSQTYPGLGEDLEKGQRVQIILAPAERHSLSE